MSAVQATETALSDRKAIAREVPAGRRAGFWGMVLFLLTDLVIFAGMIASYFYLRFVTSDVWPPPGIENPKLLNSGVETALLLTSSAPLVWADLGIKKGKRLRLMIGLSVTIVLGMCFLSVQYIEYAATLKKYGPTTNSYGSLFFMITSFHGLHVLTGVLMLVFVLIAALAGRINQEQHVRVRMVALFWHLVDAIWVAIFLTLYISPRL